MWIGNICVGVGMILMANRAVWVWILIIKGERTIDHISWKLFWLGSIIFFTGIVIAKAAKPKDAQKKTPGQDERECGHL